MAADLAQADVVFVGEQHDDPNTHRLERALLEGAARGAGRDIVLSLEMFERDVQEPLDALSRWATWPRTSSSKSRPGRVRDGLQAARRFRDRADWSVVAANVPGPSRRKWPRAAWRCCSRRARSDRKLFAAELKCPVGDDYFKRFAEAMGEPPARQAHRPTTRAARPSATTSRSASRTRRWPSRSLRPTRPARAGDRHPTLVHFNGAFHSDYRQGTAAARRSAAAQTPASSSFQSSRLQTWTD